MEIWTPIYGYEGLYKISSTGKILSIANNIILKTRIKKNGYEVVKLCNNKKHTHYLVHRLVAITFKLNPENKREVNHINGIKTDNRVENIEWVTSSENQKHAFRLGLQKIRRGREMKSSKPIGQYSIDGELIKRWESFGEIHRELGYNKQGICNCCKNRKKYKTAYGFKWQYI